MPKYDAETGLHSIHLARQHQLSIGYTPQHDARHGVRELTEAAMTYLDGHTQAGLWPWDAESFKPGDRVDDLARAGALIAAAIDLLLMARSES